MDLTFVDEDGFFERAAGDFLVAELEDLGTDSFKLTALEFFCADETFEGVFFVAEGVFLSLSFGEDPTFVLRFEGVLRLDGELRFEGVLRLEGELCFEGVLRLEGELCFEGVVFVDAMSVKITLAGLLDSKVVVRLTGEDLLPV